MIDSTTRKVIRISSDGTAGPYIVVPVGQLHEVRKVLGDNGIPHWVDHQAISVDGRPAVTVVYLRKGIDLTRVQALLDAAA